MTSTERRPWQTLESWSPTAFLVAGTLLAVFVVLSSASAWTDVLGQGALVGAAVVGSGISGLVVAVVGTLGLYPRLRATAPWLSRAGLGALAGALTGILVVVGTLAVVGPPEYPGDVPAFVPPVFILSGLLIMVGIATFAAASIRTSTPSRRVGVLLVVPVVVLLWHYAVLAAVGSQHIFEAIDYTIISTAFLAVGYLLRTESVSTTDSEQVHESPT